MSFTKVAPAGIGTEPGTSIRIGDSLLHSIGIDLGSGTGIGASITRQGNATFTGIVTAQKFIGDISGATGASAGLGTALSNTQTSPLNKLYYTNEILSIGATITVDHPATATGAYTQYADIRLEQDADLIIEDGDDVIPNILGLGTDGGGLGAGGSGRIRVDSITNKNANGAPNFPNGLTIAGTETHVTPEKFGAIAKPVIESETRIWYNAMNTKPKREHLRSMDMLVKRLKWSGIWTELDTLYAFASHNKADSLINVKNPGTANLSETATATFTAGKGFTAGSSGRLATSVNFNTFATQYTANDAHIGVFMFTEGVRDNSPIAGVNDGTEDVYIIPLRVDSDQLRGRISTSTGSDFTNTKSSGSFILSRTGAQIIAYRNGFELGHDVKNSEGVPSDKLEVLLVTSSDGGGLISFLHTGDKLDGSKSRAFAWIMQEYINEVEQGYDEGNTVTVSQLDASVGLSTNTTAMQNFLNASVGSTLGLLGDETYLVNDKLSIPDSPNIQGIIGKSTIKADNSMNNTKPLLVQGSKDNQSIGGRIDGLIVDYNVDRTSSSGGLSEDTDGNAFSLHNVQGGRYTNITAMSGRKHGFDILGNTYNRTGIAYSFNQRHNLTSRNIHIDNIIAIGNGDDGFSTHGAESVSYTHLTLPTILLV